MRIVAQPNLARVELTQLLERMPGVDLAMAGTPQDLLAAMANADVLVISGHGYTRDVARRLAEPSSTVRFVQLLTAGYEDAAQIGLPERVAMANAGESWSLAVAEHAMALMLALVKCLPRAFAGQQGRTWDRSFSPGMGTLSGQTLAILGYGSIGREVAIRAKAFGMHVIGVSRSPQATPPADEVMPADRLHEVLPRADVIVLSMPSSSSSHHIIDARTLAMCKRGAILVNIARGDLVDTAALVAALESGQLAGAGIDATDPEPLPPDSPLWNAPNAIVTPHISGACGPSGRQRLASFVAGNIERFMSGQTPLHLLRLTAYHP